MSQVENKSGLLIGGGVVAGIVASLCCVGPLVLTVLGVSGAAVLSKFEILRIPMILLVFAVFGIAGFLLYRKRNTCELGSICADPKKFKKMLIMYWVGFALAVAGITSPYWVLWIFG